MSVIRNRLLGAWELVSFTGNTPSGREFLPMGAGVTGRLLYTHDCLDPRLIGTLQERHVRFIDDQLELSVPRFALEKFDAPMFLLWHRCPRAR